MTPQEKLDEAIRTNDIDLLNQAIDEECEFHCKIDTPSFYADKNVFSKAISNEVSKDFIETLLNRGAQAYISTNIFKEEESIYNIFDIKSYDPLSHAIHYDRADLVEVFLNRISLEQKCKNALLHNALGFTNCSVDTISVIIKEGAEICHGGYIKGDFNSSLHIFLKQRERSDEIRSEIASLLFSHGAEVVVGLSEGPDDTLTTAIDHPRNGRKTYQTLFDNGAVIVENPESYYGHLRIAAYPTNFVVRNFAYLFDARPDPELTLEEIYMTPDVRTKVTKFFNERIIAIAQRGNSDIDPLKKIPADLLGKIAEYDRAEDGSIKKLHQAANSYDNILAQRKYQNEPDPDKSILTWSKRIEEQPNRESTRKKSITESRKEIFEKDSSKDTGR